MHKVEKGLVQPAFLVYIIISIDVNVGFEHLEHSTPETSWRISRTDAESISAWRSKDARQVVLRGGSESSDSLNVEDTKKAQKKSRWNAKSKEENSGNGFGNHKDTEESGESEGAADLIGKRPKSKRYAHLPDEGTEMAWRLADLILSRRGTGSKERHAASREKGKRRAAQTETLKKLQHGSKRQQQGGTAHNVSELTQELLSYGMMLLSGTTSGKNASRSSLIRRGINVVMSRPRAGIPHALRSRQSRGPAFARAAAPRAPFPAPCRDALPPPLFQELRRRRRRRRRERVLRGPERHLRAQVVQHHGGARVSGPGGAARGPPPPLPPPSPPNPPT